MIDNTGLIAFTCDLVRTPGLSGEEQAVATRVEAEMRRLGFDTVETDVNGSVAGVIRGAQPGPTILLDAHTDTVGISPGVPWAHEPYGAQIDGDAIYGRGSADMKGALAAMIYAAASVERAALRGRVVVSASTLEEVLEGVTLRTVMQRYAPDFVLIGESTDLGIARGGRGRAEVHLTTTGIPAHSSSPHLGRNAVLDMVTVIAALQWLELAEDALVGPAILALTDMISDPWPGHSVIPSQCKVTYDRRLLPGESAQSVLGEILGARGIEGLDLKAVIGVGRYRAFTGVVLEAEKFFPAWVLAEEHMLVQGALRGLNQIGMTPRVGAYRFCTNAAYSAGMAGVPTIGFGPGSESDAHTVDEHLRLEDLKAAAAGYAAIIEAVHGDGLLAG